MIDGVVALGPGDIGDDPTATFRDVYIHGTDDIGQNRPLVGRGFGQIFPFRYTVSHPRLRAFGINAQVRFGGEAG